MPLPTHDNPFVMVFVFLVEKGSYTFNMVPSNLRADVERVFYERQKYREENAM